MGPFQTNKAFSEQMRPHALRVYRQVFPGCRYEPAAEVEGVGEVLDRDLAIDAMLILPSGPSFSLQEKYRAHKYLVNKQYRIEPGFPDFTQEHTNAAGTEHEAEGEWFHLFAQLYFYGWASADETRFAKWILLDVPRYKLLVEKAGGLDAIGERRVNKAHGRAIFYAIPVSRLLMAIVASDVHPSFITTGGI